MHVFMPGTIHLANYNLIEHRGRLLLLFSLFIMVSNCILNFYPYTHKLSVAFTPPLKFWSLFCFVAVDGGYYRYP